MSTHQRIGDGRMVPFPDWPPHRHRVVPTACGTSAPSWTASHHPVRVDCTRCKAAQS